MKAHHIVVAGAIGLALTAGGLAVAAHNGAGPFAGHGPGHFREKFGRLHAEFVTERVLRAAEATPEQRQKVQAILDKALADHERFCKEHQTLREEAIEIFTADTIDRSRLEEMRARHLQIAAQGSRQVVAALADVADVLTPEQRQKVAAHVRQMFE
jgi:Spy/CpxP family protein refolding chaperone